MAFVEIWQESHDNRNICEKYQLIFVFFFGKLLLAVADPGFPRGAPATCYLVKSLLKTV